ncbi:MAG: ATP-binding cassette domain-containing protein [Candidatus Marinimicrobia bacterium]|nr:ATP-binding cassette domain-containing protein [Candidatus Neomarinimicrobiota bacterium]
MGNNETVLSINNLSFYFQGSRPDETQEIFSNISIDVSKGEVIGIVGLSGCGKTTFGKALINYFAISGINHKLLGDVYYITQSKEYRVNSKEYRRKFKVPPIQMIYQDPKISLNPKMPVAKQLRESLTLNNKKIDDDIWNKLINEFQLRDFLNKTPENISGGQRRRVGIAKILASLSTLPDEIPKIIIADEPVASLDASIKNEIMDRIVQLKKWGYSIIIISHDISLIKREANIIYVMDEIRHEIVEIWDPKNNHTENVTKELDDDSKFINQYFSATR